MLHQEKLMRIAATNDRLFSEHTPLIHLLFSHPVVWNRDKKVRALRKHWSFQCLRPSLIPTKWIWISRYSALKTSANKRTSHSALRNTISTALNNSKCDSSTTKTQLISVLRQLGPVNLPQERNVWSLKTAKLNQTFLQSQKNSLISDCTFQTCLQRPTKGSIVKTHAKLVVRRN